MAQALMEYETITGEECKGIMRGDKISRPTDDDGSKGPAGSAVPSAGRQPPRPRGEPSGGIDIGPEPQPQ
jgi:cell division protease FtsH